MRKFLTVVGTRPHLIKFDSKLKQILVWSGQHYSKLLKDVFFKGLKIPRPDYDLGETELGAIIDKLTPIVKKEKPDYMIVYGDTRSTLAGAVVALYENIPLIHIEAGCRSGNDSMPEERIRKIVDEIAIIHLTPSLKTKEFLEQDYRKTQVYFVGATQIDTMLQTFPTHKPKDAYEYCVATIHREANTNKAVLEAIFRGFEASGKQIRLYCHPRTEKALKANSIRVPKNVKILKPLPYKEMINAVAFADKVITDSGGLQVEAFVLRRPCITLRNETEWKETVDYGWNQLVGTDEKEIAEAIKEPFTYSKSELTIYGGGDAKEKIRMLLENL